jgi:hypothetical protein
MTANSAFTPDRLDQRIKDMREIAAHVVQSFHTDLDHDEYTIRNKLDVPRWLWVPYEQGSHLAALVPHGKRWASQLASFCQCAYKITSAPYLVTPERITAITWEVAVAMIADLPAPTYQVTDRHGATLLQTREWRQALKVLEADQDAAALTETVAGLVIVSKVREAHEHLHPLYEQRAEVPAERIWADGANVRITAYHYDPERRLIRIKTERTTRAGGA